MLDSLGTEEDIEISQDNLIPEEEALEVRTLPFYRNSQLVARILLIIVIVGVAIMYLLKM